MEEGFLLRAFSEQASADWKLALSNQLIPSYFSKIEEHIIYNVYAGKPFYPSVDQIFRSLELTPLSDVKCVILGQDPYHQPNQAMGLAFSVPQQCKIPPSLRNIFKELVDDMLISNQHHGDLTSWAKKGVLLLNSILTVSDSLPLSHQNRGWEEFVRMVLITLSNQNPCIVFILWGKSAQTFSDCIDDSKHMVIKGNHPSPLSAHRGFFGSKPFSKTNNPLISHGKLPIDWQLEP